jgi:hypothetical protein
MFNLHKQYISVVFTTYMQNVTVKLNGKNSPGIICAYDPTINLGLK